MGTTEKYANENHWNLVSSGTTPDILLGVIYPPTRNIRYERHTCNRRVNKCIEYKLLSLTYEVANLITHIANLSVQSTCKTRSSFVVTLA